ncbi:hypothetical protein DRN73_07290 [Candidatus Pacearchaeota archaeon]|nr:MAG: hypothetical protein DRN73_07290 [Candidatus Pacearchaeota archaeon]
MKDSNLDNLKKRYSVLQKKYSLPSFQEMNEDFVIEKVSEEDSEILIREIRKFIADRFMNYLRFVETILNPSSASIFIFSIVKSLKKEEKDELEEIYKKLAKFELDLIELDVSFSEEKEAEFIKNSFKVWQEVKRDFLKVIQKIKKDWSKDEDKKNKSFIA